MKSHEDYRKELWSNVAVAYTGASNSTSARKIGDWADIVLEAFDERFKDGDKKDD
ncbi:MAG: hypothetical protein QQN63_00175 [Nitrosopumilus sp.]